MSDIQEQFETLVAQRMERFQILLNNARFSFKQYQYDGVKWCVRNELSPNPVANVRGGFIADEMGLGKTIMMIGVMFVNFLPRTLIVVPPVLIQQWHTEILKASGHNALLYYGPHKSQVTQEEVNSAKIVLTTYNTLCSPNCLLKNIGWNRVIFDEAHHLRNSNTRRFENCRQIRARVRWLVTGTPVQNRKHDFYSLCAAAGIKAEYYINPANRRTIGKNFVLRRTKEQVGINLPPVSKETCVVPWANQKEMLLSEEIHALLPNQCHVSKSKAKRIAQLFGAGGTLTALLRAKQSCILPNLMRQSMETFHSCGLIETSDMESLNYTSKLDAIIDLLVRRKNNGKGKIIFCHFQKEIDVIACRLKENDFEKVVTYDGRNSGGKNLANLADQADALIIQIQTGCEGLNLQRHFSEIYFVSPHWNPCVEDQAIARCHRIGQTKPVNVFKFEMNGFKNEKNQLDKMADPNSLEKYVNYVQDAKRVISNEILSYANTTAQ